MTDWKIIHINETDSTNRWLREDKQLTANSQQPIAVWADYQTEGRGCGTNTWESERDMNLLFSLLIHPEGIPVVRQFHISMAMSLAICEALGQYIGDLSIKWPNDIYWHNRKICGMLIENTLYGSSIKDSIIGVGVNVNQRVFRSDAPNPVSVWQICGQETDRQKLLLAILHCLDHYLYQDVKAQYCAMLYRRKGFYPYADKDGTFMAEIAGVEDDGHLVLCVEDGRTRRYAFKEVRFV